MPSYYDSTKTKPGLAEIKYKKGGKVKKRGKAKKSVGSSSASKERKPSPVSPFSKINPRSYTPESITRFHESLESGRGDYSLLVPGRKPAKKPKGEKSPSLFSKINPRSYIPESIKEFTESGGKDFSRLVPKPEKKMKGGGTVARGSGAARKQTFGKNG